MAAKSATARGRATTVSTEGAASKRTTSTAAASAERATAMAASATKGTTTAVASERTAARSGRGTWREAATAEGTTSTVAASKHIVGAIVAGAIAKTIVVAVVAKGSVVSVAIAEISVAEGAVACYRGACAALAVAKVLSSAIVATVESVSHAHSRCATRAWCAKFPSMVPAPSAIHSPAMSTSIHGIEMRSAKEEIVSARVSGIDAEMPITIVPVERAIEIGSVEEGTILPVEQNVAQVHVALSPVYAI